MTDIKIEAKKVTPASELTNSLAPTEKDKKEGKRSIYFELDPIQSDLANRVKVSFIGHWDGYFIKVALREIQRAYSHRRHNKLYKAHK